MSSLLSSSFYPRESSFARGMVNYVGFSGPVLRVLRSQSLSTSRKVAAYALCFFVLLPAHMLAAAADIAKSLCKQVVVIMVPIGGLVAFCQGRESWRGLKETLSTLLEWSREAIIDFRNALVLPFLFLRYAFKGELMPIKLNRFDRRSYPRKGEILEARMRAAIKHNDPKTLEDFFYTRPWGTDEQMLKIQILACAIRRGEADFLDRLMTSKLFRQFQASPMEQFWLIYNACHHPNQIASGAWDVLAESLKGPDALEDLQKYHKVFDVLQQYRILESINEEGVINPNLSIEGPQSAFSITAAAISAGRIDLVPKWVALGYKIDYVDLHALKVLFEAYSVGYQGSGEANDQRISRLGRIRGKQVCLTTKSLVQAASINLNGQKHDPDFKSELNVENNRYFYTLIRYQADEVFRNCFNEHVDARGRDDRLLWTYRVLYIADMQFYCTHFAAVIQKIHQMYMKQMQQIDAIQHIPPELHGMVINYVIGSEAVIDKPSMNAVEDDQANNDNEVT